jgi:UDP-2,4-diacetamido-2,4,6-trideoxy-beta-L-altropyranose hydrolase
VSAPHRILFAPACGPKIGGGHILRDIALAEALGRRRADCTFALHTYGAAILERFGGSCADVYPLPHPADPQALAAAVGEVRPDVLVLDGYGFDADTVERLGPARPRVAVIDDLADRRQVCELLVDPGYGRATKDYGGLVPIGCRVLAGPAFALLRPGFEVDRAPAATRPKVERVFVSLGLGEVDGVAGRVVERLRAASPDVRIDVALGADTASVARLRARAARDGKLALHIDAQDVAALLRAADVAVGAGGASTWERCALGVPSLAVIVADNQRRVVRALKADGVTLACDLHEPGFEAAFDAAWARLQDPALRATLAARSRVVCDGRGAGRVAEAILAL